MSTSGLRRRDDREAPGGKQIRLGRATDIVPNVIHSTAAQATAIDGGRMDGFAKINGCGAGTNYQCLTQFMPSQIPNLADLATHFAVSDRTFEMDAIPSWGAHIELVAAKLDGFTGDNPAGNQSIGWGCDSKGRPMAGDAQFIDPAAALVRPRLQAGPDHVSQRRRLPLDSRQAVPTIMDELDRGGALVEVLLRPPAREAATAGPSARRSPSASTASSTATWCRADG